jgi:hypothetical protein
MKPAVRYEFSSWGAGSLACIQCWLQAQWLTQSNCSQKQSLAKILMKQPVAWEWLIWRTRLGARTEDT